MEEQFYEVGEVDTDRHLAVQICALTRGAENERFSTSFVTLSTASGTAIGGFTGIMLLCHYYESVMQFYNIKFTF